MADELFEEWWNRSHSDIGEASDEVVRLECLAAWQAAIAASVGGGAAGVDAPIEERLPPEPVSHPSETWCDEYAEWHEWFVDHRKRAALTGSAGGDATGGTEG